MKGIDETELMTVRTSAGEETCPISCGDSSVDLYGSYPLNKGRSPIAAL